MTYHGILNIDKPAGWTSHDIVAKVRRLLGQKSVGHAGTLDPMATGVLLVCAGQATRVSEYLMAGRKVYRAVIRLGLVTDTYDIEGATVREQPVPSLPRDGLSRALDRFIGPSEQVPPAYSAIKQHGVPAYRRARRGEEVALPARPVTIQRIDLLDWQPPDLTCEVTCDPGTYIRSLAHDLGAALGCGGTLAALRRMQSGQFRAENGVGLDDLAASAAAGEIARHLHPLRTALASLTPVEVDAEAITRLTRGQPIPCPASPTTPEGYALQPDGDVIAILAYHPADGQWWPRKVFGIGE